MLINDDVGGMIISGGSVRKNEKIKYEKSSKRREKLTVMSEKRVVVRVSGMRCKVWWYGTKVNVVLDTLIYPNIIMERKNTTTTTTNTQQHTKKYILQSREGVGGMGKFSNVCV